MAIPRGCRNPDKAWEFIRWMCHSEEGTTLVGEAQLILPAMLRSPFFKTALKKKYYDRVKNSVGPLNAMRFLQVENQLERLIDLQLSAQLPVEAPQ